MLKGFRDFILRGNVVDLAVAVVMGEAFHALVNSMVKDILSQILSAVAGKTDFSKVVFHLGQATVNVGNFFNATVTFLIDAAVIYFLIVLPLNALQSKFKKHEHAAATTKVCPECLSDIPVQAHRCRYCAQPVSL